MCQPWEAQSQSIFRKVCLLSTDKMKSKRRRRWKGANSVEQSWAMRHRYKSTQSSHLATISAGVMALQPHKILASASDCDTDGVRSPGVWSGLKSVVRCIHFLHLVCFVCSPSQLSSDESFALTVFQPEFQTLRRWRCVLLHKICSAADCGRCWTCSPAWPNLGECYPTVVSHHQHPCWAAIRDLKEGLGAAIMRGGGPFDTTIRRLGWGK